MAAPRVCLARLKVSGVVGRERISRRFRRLCRAALLALALPPLRSLSDRGWWRSLQERGALREDCFKRVYVFLDPLSALDRGKLDPGECATVRTEVPAGDQVAGGRLVVDLRRGGERQVQLGREVEMEVEILLRRCAIDIDRGVGEGRGRWHHQQGQGLRPGGREGLFFAIGDVVC
jgi:hypothetical protein